jgi:hypothetical protein
MRPMRVVMLDVGRKDALEVTSTDDQEPVEALAAYRADPSFGERVRIWCSHGCADRPDALGAEHLVERGRELAVTVVDQEPDRLASFDERLDDVPCPSGDPLPGRVRGDARQMHLPRRQLDEHEHVHAAEQHRVDGEEIAGDDPAGLRAQELPPRLRRPTRHRIDPSLPEDRPDRAGCNPNAEAGEFALDPPVAPTRVLPRQPLNQRPHARVRCRSSRRPMRIRPTPRDQRPMPTTNRLGTHKYAAPPVARKHPNQRGQEHPVSRTAACPGHLPPQHRELVTQQKDLDLVLGV